MTEQLNGRAPPVTVPWPAVADFAEAVRLRDLLQGEAGHPYQVHPSGDGFVVARAEASSDERAPRHGTDRTQAIDLVEFRPAWRVGWGKGLTALLAGGVALTAQDFVPVILDRGLGVSIADTVSRALPITPGDAVAGAALLICFLVLGRWIYGRYSRLYRVTHDAIEEVVGIVAIQTRRVRLQHVRSVGLQQTVFGRIFNVGTLEFASAGTGEIDIRFAGIRRPATVRSLIHERIHRTSGNPHGARA